MPTKIIVYKMNVQALKTLLSIPTVSRNEYKMVEHLAEHFASRRMQFTVDKNWNVFAVRRSESNPDAPLPCLAAHIDTVHDLGEIEVIENAGRLSGYRGNVPVGIGGDDKAGIHVCLEIADRLDHVAVALFSMEEIGYRGAMSIDGSLFKDVGYVIEFDCPSRNMVSYSAGGERLFEDDAPFINTALPVLQKHGSVLWQNHPYTDVTALRRRFPISCLNLSCGYYRWHTAHEFVKISEVDMAIQLGTDLVKALGNNRYECALAFLKSNPALPIGTLRVPNP